MTGRLTLMEKLWATHEIVAEPDGRSLLWVDRHFVHEGSHHAFAKLEARGQSVAESGLTVGVADHYVPTRHRGMDIADAKVRRMVEMLEENAGRHGVHLFGLDDPRQGIVHVVGPEQGLTLPGMVVTCGDSHTATHGAMGAFAFGDPMLVAVGLIAVVGSVLVVLNPGWALAALAAFAVLRLGDVATDAHGLPSPFPALVGLVLLAIAYRWASTGVRPWGGGRAMLLVGTYLAVALGSLLFASDPTAGQAVQRSG